MTDGPRDGAVDPAAAGSAPWERPARWGADADAPPAAPTRVDDLVAKLGADETGQRRIRRPAGDEAVPAGELIEALQNARDADPDATVLTSPAAPALTPSALTPPAHPPAPAASVPPAIGSWSVVTPPVGPAGTPTPTGADPFPDALTVVPAPTLRTPPFPASSSAGDPEATMVLPTTRPAAQTGPASPATPADHDEATRLMSQDRATAAAIRAALTSSLAGVPPPSEPGVTRSGPAGRSRRGTRGLMYTGRSAVALLAAALLLVTGYEWTLLKNTDQGLADRRVAAIQTNDTHISTPTKIAGTTAAGAAPGQPAAPVYQAENILLLGSDTRAGANGNAGNSDQSTVGTAQSDTVMIAHISANRQHVTIVSIPRDLRVDAPQCKEWNPDTGVVSNQDWQIQPGERWKITNAYSVGGPMCSVKAIQQLTGLRIDRMIGIDFVGFKTMVDALGGITVNICKPIKDAELGVIVPAGGVQNIKGDQAVNLVRARTVIGDSEGDFGRIRRQQQVLSALLRQAVSAKTLLNPFSLRSFLNAFVNATYTANVTVDSMLQLAKSMGSLNPSKVTFYTLPTYVDPNDSQDGQLLDTKAQAVFNALINDLPLPGEKPDVVATTAVTKPPATRTTPPRTTAPAEKLTVPPVGVNLELVNVSGRTGVAGQAQGLLNPLGFAISDNQLTLPPDGQVHQEVTVLYAPTNRAAALTVAAAVPGAILEQQADLGTKVRLLLGSSFDGKVSAVKVGDPVPTSLAITTATAGSPTRASSSATKSAPSLGKTDLSSVNAATATCV